MSSPSTWTEVHARRLTRHHLDDPAGAEVSCADVVAAMCGAHAQVLTAAEWSIGLRLAGRDQADVRAALWQRRELVKTFGPRGTVHLLATRDLPMWIGALSALPAGRSPFPDGVRLDAAQLDTVVAAIGDALADGEPRTADELDDEIAARAGGWASERVMPAFQDLWPRWRQAVATAAARGALCFGPNRGRKVTYTSPARWLPGLRPSAGPDALAALVRHFLHAYGPATHQHFAQWLGVAPGWAGELFASLAGTVERVEIGGTAAWQVAGDTAVTGPPGGVRLLPYFDAYAVGSHPREVVFPGRAGPRALGGGQAGNFPVLLVDGVAAGVWHQRRAGRHLDVTVEPLDPLSRTRRAGLDDQVERLGGFLGLRPRLTIGEITVGPHA